MCVYVCVCGCGTRVVVEWWVLLRARAVDHVQSSHALLEAIRAACADRIHAAGPVGVERLRRDGRGASALGKPNRHVYHRGARFPLFPDTKKTPDHLLRQARAKTQASLHTREAYSFLQVKLPGGGVFWRGAGKLVSWTAEPTFFPDDGFIGLSKAGAVATADKKPMPLLLYSLWWEPNSTAAYYKAKYLLRSMLV
jgi:hypothetical protein